MQMSVDDIIIKERIRKNLGDLDPLMESMRNHGLMNPIVVNIKNELIAGHRRLEAAKRLGWNTVDVTVNDSDNHADQLEMEIEENVQRKNLSSEELADAYIRLDKLRNPSIIKRIIQWFKKLFRKIFKKDKRIE